MAVRTDAGIDALARTARMGTGRRCDPASLTGMQRRIVGLLHEGLHAAAPMNLARRFKHK
jgi:hypothetical protein